MRIDDLDTPCVLIDLDKVEANIAAMQGLADRYGVALRPHAKTHKMPILAHKQIEAGAAGITVAKLGEAEVMAAGGIRDILIAYPIVGRHKMDRLIRLAKQAKITVAVDSCEAAAAISAAVSSEPNCRLGIALEIDCGFRRVGVSPGEAALAAARKIAQLPGLYFRGITTFAGHSYGTADDDQLVAISTHEGKTAAQTAEFLRTNGIPVEMVSVGSTPSSKYAAQVPGVTEIRPGTYLFGDLMQVDNRSHSLEYCALTVRVTVISRPAPDRAVIDAGTKVFTSDGGDTALGTGRGYVPDKPGLIVSWLTEEHGMLKVPPQYGDLRVGDTLEIIPLHACAVVNMVDEVAAVRKGKVEAIWPVWARGKVT